MTTATVGGVVHVRIRGDASAEYETPLTYTLIVTAGVVVEYDFVITTMADPTTFILLNGDFLTIDGFYLTLNSVI